MTATQKMPERKQDKTRLAEAEAEKKARRYTDEEADFWQKRCTRLEQELAILRKNSIEEYLSRQIEWSRKTFGNLHRTIGITKHIEKEIAEVRKNPLDLLEWIDIIILGIDGFWRHGGRAENLMEKLQEKQNRNFTRQYPFPISEDEPSEHNRGKPE